MMISMSPRATACLVFILMCVSLASNAERVDVDFARDIRPILQAHCYECHGPERSENDLRLDRFDSVRRGGETGGNLFSSDLEQNELYQRVIATDPDVRMPPEGDPLSKERIATIKRWVEQGADWPEDSPTPEPGAGLWGTIRTFYVQHVAPHRYALFAVVLLVGVMERMKVRRKRQASDTSQHKLADTLARLPRVWYLVIIFGWLAGYLWVDRGRLTDEIDRLSLLDLPLNDQIYARLHGDPPRAIRPDQPVGLARTYYRGNDERSPELFNNGFYRTATIRLALTDSQGNRLSAGDPAPGAGGLIEIEIIRSPGTTSRLYDPKIWQRIAVVDASQPDGTAMPNRGPWSFLPTSADQSWSCQVPIVFHDDTSTSATQGWLNIGAMSGSDTTTGLNLHFGIRYDIRIADGKIAEGSDLWMNNLYKGDQLQYPYPKGAVPMAQWFSTQPIPEVQGENPDDPELLGENEHLDGE